MSRRRSPAGWLRLGSAALAFATLAAATAAAVSPKTWTVRSQKDVLEGEAAGLRIAPSGEMTLAPRVVAQSAIEEAVVWSLAPGPGGATWVGTGSAGRLLLVSARGEVSEAARFDELQVTALLADGDSVWAATSPQGAVYHVRKGEKPVVVARPKSQYIWEIARDEAGTLFVATGTEGIIYAIRGGEAKVFYKAADLHVVSLLAFPDGSLVAGTDERGLVLRIAADGTAAVLYDSPFKEARALALGPKGVLYAAINGGSSYREAPGGGAKPAGGEATVNVTAEAEGPAPPGGLTLAPVESLGEVSSEVVRIPPGGPVEAVARLRGEIVYALSIAERGELLVGTSKRLLVPAGGEDVSVVALERAGQVSALAHSFERLLVGTTGPSRLFALEPEVAREGTYTSKVFAPEGEARFGALRAEADVPDGMAIAFDTRTGGTVEPDATWSKWAPLGDGGRIASPAARYVQWRARFGPKTPPPRVLEAPRLRSVSVTYVPRNLRPVIKSFTALPPGLLLQKSASPQNVVEAAPPPLPSMFEELAPPKAEAAGSSKRAYRRGAQTLAWEISDPNDDDLDVRLVIVSRAGGPTLLLREHPEGNSFTFDTQALPDGWYTARLEVTDAPSNPRDSALAATRDAEPILVDNTPPRVTLASSRLEGGKGHVRFEAADALSPLWKAEWSLDGGAFAPLFPADGITDSLLETYEVETGDLAKGEHLIVVRLTDLANQSAAAAAVVKVP